MCLSPIFGDRPKMTPHLSAKSFLGFPFENLYGVSSLAAGGLPHCFKKTLGFGRLWKRRAAGGERFGTSHFAFCRGWRPFRIFWCRGARVRWCAGGSARESSRGAPRPPNLFLEVRFGARSPFSFYSSPPAFSAANDGGYCGGGLCSRAKRGLGV